VDRLCAGYIPDQAEMYNGTVDDVNQCINLCQKLSDQNDAAFHCGA